METREFTFAAYTIRAGEKGKKGVELGGVSGKDIAIIFEEFITSRSKSHVVDEAAQEMSLFNGVERKDRTITGYLDAGSFGSKGVIVRKNKGKVFDVTQDDANMVKYYFHAFLPSHKDTGIIVLQTIGRGGVSTVFHRDFPRFVREKHSDITIRLERHTSEDYVRKLVEGGVAKKLKFTSLTPPQDLTERLTNAGLDESEIVVEIIVKSRNGISLAPLTKWFGKDSNDETRKKILAIPGEGFDDEKASVNVELGGKARTMRVDTKALGRPDYYEQLPLGPDGEPTRATLAACVQGLVNNITSELFK